MSEKSRPKKLCDLSWRQHRCLYLTKTRSCESQTRLAKEDLWRHLWIPLKKNPARVWWLMMVGSYTMPSGRLTSPERALPRATSGLCPQPSSQQKNLLAHLELIYGSVCIIVALLYIDPILLNVSASSRMSWALLLLLSWNFSHGMRLLMSGQNVAACIFC